MKMEKVLFEILYKNGHQDTFEQVVDSEEIAREIQELIEVAKESMRIDEPAVITIGDGEEFGVLIRTSEVSRIKTTYVECGSK